MELNNLNKDRKRRKPSFDLTMIYGKVPPQAKEVEEAVLGAVLVEKGAIDLALEILTPDNFYVDAHQKIFSAMRRLAQKSQPVDLLTVVQELMSTEELEKVGGAYAVSKLTNNVVTAAHMEAHCRIVLQKSMARQLIHIGGVMVNNGYDETLDVFDQIDEAEAAMLSVVSNNVKRDYRSIDSGLVKVIRKIETLRHREETITGVPSGFPTLDKCTNGWQNTDLIIIAARPSVGKTAFALNLALNAAEYETKQTAVGIFSLEMSETQLVERLLSAETKIAFERIQKARFDETQMKDLYSNGVQKLAKVPIFIDDTAGLNMFELRAKARRMKNKHQVGLIIIDYLQLMTGDSNDSKNREREIAKISRELKKLAKELELPIIALSQMSREVEKRKTREPQLADLRESGAIEQDADMVLFLYRPTPEDIKRDPELKNKGWLKIAKNRHGDLIDYALWFKGWIQRWEEIVDGLDAGGSYKPVSIDFTEPKKTNLGLSSQPADDEIMPF